MTSINLNPNRKTVYNPTPTELSWRWGGVYYFIAPEGTLAGPLGIIEHLLKHLSVKGLKTATEVEAVNAKYKEFVENQMDGIRDLTEHIPVSQMAPIRHATKTVSTPKPVVKQEEVKVEEKKEEVVAATQEPYTHCDLPNCIMIKEEAELENYIHCNGIDKQTGELCQYTNTEAGVLMHQRTKHRVVTHGK